MNAKEYNKKETFNKWNNEKAQVVAKQKGLGASTVFARFASDDVTESLVTTGKYTSDGKTEVQETTTEYTVGGSSPPYVYALLLHEDKNKELCQFKANHRQLRSDQFRWEINLQKDSVNSNNSIIKHLTKTAETIKTELRTIQFLVTPFQISPIAADPEGSSKDESYTEAEAVQVVNDAKHSSEDESDPNAVQVVNEGLVLPILAHQVKSPHQTERIQACCLDSNDAKDLYHLVVIDHKEDDFKNIKLPEDSSLLALLYFRAALKAMSDVSLGALYQIIMSNLPKTNATKSHHNWNNAAIHNDTGANVWLFKETVRLIQEYSPIRLAVMDGLHRIFSVANIFRGEIPSTGPELSLPLTELVTANDIQEKDIENYLKAARELTKYDCVNFTYGKENCHSVLIPNHFVGKLRDKSFDVQKSVQTANPTEHIIEVVSILREVGRGGSEFCWKTLNDKTAYGELEAKKIERFLAGVQKYSSCDKIKNFLKKNYLQPKSKKPPLDLDSYVVHHNSSSKPGMAEAWLTCVACMASWFASNSAASHDVCNLLESRGDGLGRSISGIDKDVLARFPLFWKSDGQVISENQLPDNMIQFAKRFFLWVLSDLSKAIAEAKSLANLRYHCGSKKDPKNKPQADKVFDDVLATNIAFNVIKVYKDHGFFMWNVELDPLLPAQTRILDEMKSQHSKAIIKDIQKGKEPSEPIVAGCLWIFPPFSLMKACQVFPVMVRAIENGLLLPSMALERNVHFQDGSGKSRKLQRIYKECTQGDFEPMLSWGCTVPDMPEVLKGSKSISVWATLLFKVEDTTVNFMKRSFEEAEAKSLKTKETATVEFSDTVKPQEEQAYRAMTENLSGKATGMRGVIDGSVYHDKPQANSQAKKSRSYRPLPLACVVPVHPTNRASSQERSVTVVTTRSTTKEVTVTQHVAADFQRVSDQCSKSPTKTLALTTNCNHQDSAKSSSTKVFDDQDSVTSSSSSTSVMDAKESPTYSGTKLIESLKDSEPTQSLNDSFVSVGSLTTSNNQDFVETSNTEDVDTLNETSVVPVAPPETSDNQDGVEGTCDTEFSDNQDDVDCDTEFSDNQDDVEGTGDTEFMDCLKGGGDLKHCGLTTGSSDGSEQVQSPALLTNASVVEHGGLTTDSSDGSEQVQSPARFTNASGDISCPTILMPTKVTILDKSSKADSKLSESSASVLGKRKRSATPSNALITAPTLKTCSTRSRTAPDKYTPAAPVASPKKFRKSPKSPAPGAAKATSLSPKGHKLAAPLSLSSKCRKLKPKPLSVARAAKDSSAPASSPTEPDQMLNDKSDPENSPDNFFIEELAFKYCSTSKNLQENIAPLPKPIDFVWAPPQRQDGVKWILQDKAMRLVLANFRGVTDIHFEHKRYLAELLEKDEVTVICEGLRTAPDAKAFLETLCCDFGKDPYYNFGQFDKIEKDGFSFYKEQNEKVSMKACDFHNYLNIMQSDEDQPKSFTYKNGAGENVVIKDVTKVAFYMLDVNMEEHMHLLLEQFNATFKMKEILPGGVWCMMHHVSCFAFLSVDENVNRSPLTVILCYQILYQIIPKSRPTMGPYVYITAGEFMH